MTNDQQQPTERTPDDLEVTHGPPADDEEQPDTPDATEGEENDDTGGDKATKMRKRAQAAEAERDDLRSQVQALQRQVIEQVSRLYRPAALWATGADPAALFNTDGTLDRAALAAAEDTAIQQLGVSRAPRPDPSQGPSGARDATTTWGQAFQNALHDQ